MKVLVTGAHGQLGRCIYDAYTNPNIYKVNEYLFASRYEFDITSEASMEQYLFYHSGIECIINCAGYTNVERAEEDIVEAFEVNSRGVKKLVDICEKYDIMLFHISTDYVYKDGQGICNEESEIEPLNIYGQSKRDGELFIINSNLKNWYIFRTSWLYSPYRSNFFTKIMNDYIDGKYYKSLRVVTDEIGSPTYAKSLAETLLCIIEHGYYATSFKNGIYNASGNGIASRYDFAANIIAAGYNTYIDGKRINIQRTIYPITQAELNLKAKRPHCVIMNNDKLYGALPVSRNHWIYDLSECVNDYERMMDDRNKSYKMIYG